MLGHMFDVRDERRVSGNLFDSMHALTLAPLHSGSASQFRANLFVELFLLVKTYSRRLN